MQTEVIKALERDREQQTADLRKERYLAARAESDSINHTNAQMAELDRRTNTIDYILLGAGALWLGDSVRKFIQSRKAKRGQ